MKLFSLTLLTVFACATGTHAQQTTEPLPTPGGESAPLPAIDKPVQDTKEFNQDIDDFEKKISHDVPSKPGMGSAPAPSTDKNAEKARAQMKKQLAEGSDEHPKSAMAKHKEAAAAKHAADKKAAAAKKKAKAAKKGGKKKKADSH